MVDKALDEADRQHQFEVGHGDEAVAERMEPELRPARLADPRVHVLNALGISREAVLWDSAAPGLGLRIRPNGRKTWIVRRRCNGSVVMRTLGPLDALTIEDARVAAFALLAEAVAGERGVRL